jgi:transcriptional regulator GlxA family with amidase domain
MPDNATKTVAFLLYPGLTPLDMIGPLQLLNGLGMADPSFRVTVVGERVEAMDTDIPVKLIPEQTFDQVPNPYILIVPGGGMGTLKAMGNQAIRDYVQAAAETAHTVASVCTGALILGAAGLLEGRKATTHWAYATFLERLGAHYLPQRWVEDGKFLCSAGVSAGIDMALYLGAQLTSEQLARQAQLFIEYDPQPPFGGIDWTTVDRQMMVPMLTQNVRDALADHPDLVTQLTGS